MANLDDFEKPLFVRDPGLRYRKERLDREHGRYNKAVETCEEFVSTELDKLTVSIDRLIGDFQRKCQEKFEKIRIYGSCLEDEKQRFFDELPSAIARDERRFLAIKNKLEKIVKVQAAELSKFQSSEATVKVENNPTDISKAKTLAIFDSILFAIDGWSIDGQSASDVVSGLQATLFPLVYEKVMSGNDDYYVESVPPSALEVVRRGREFVKYTRDTYTQAITNPTVWDGVSKELHMWVINDMLPLIYGARDEEWDGEVPFTLPMMLQWQDMPASRALDFPKLWDGSELVKKHGEDIRKFTGLPEFNKQQVTTRIQS